MQLQAELDPLEQSEIFRGALSQPPFSGRAFLASVLLHALVVAGVLWFSGGQHKPVHPVFVMDLKGLATGTRLTGESTPPAPPKPEAATARGTAAHALPAEGLDPGAKKVAAAGPAEVPPSPMEPLEEDPARTDAPPEAAQGSPTGVKPSDGVSEAELAYRRAVYDRVREVTLPWSVRSPRWLFEGRIAFHMCLDPSGRLLHAPVLLEHEEGILKLEYHAVPAALGLAPPDQGPAFLDWHFKALVRGIQIALEKAQPYPVAPPGLAPPENMAFPIPLNAYDPVPAAAEPG